MRAWTFWRSSSFWFTNSSRAGAGIARKEAGSSGSAISPSFFSPVAIASSRSARPAFSRPPSLERNPSRDATTALRLELGLLGRRAVGHERVREGAVQRRELVVHRRGERDHAAVLLDRRERAFAGRRDLPPDRRRLCNRSALHGVDHDAA